MSGLIDKGISLPLMEEFYSIQGEGANTGTAAYFIRLGGCNLRCPWCDVKDSWDVNAHPHVSVESIVTNVMKASAVTAIITGGEPLMHNLDDLCDQLKNKNIQTFIETSGAYPLSGCWDWICLSPKKMKKPLKEILHAANELKVVIFNKSDFTWAEEQALRVSADCKLYLQPEWDRRLEIMPQIIDYVKRRTRWKISLQTHKYIDVR